MGLSWRQSIETILLHWQTMLGAVFLLHVGGFCIGLYFAAFVQGGETVRHALHSIEVGMQNSGLGMALASKHFFKYADGSGSMCLECSYALSDRKCSCGLVE